MSDTIQIDICMIDVCIGQCAKKQATMMFMITQQKNNGPRSCVLVAASDTDAFVPPASVYDTDDIIAEKNCQFTNVK